MNVIIGPHSDDANTPRFEYVSLDKYDTFSMDNTLAVIIVPMLKQLKATKHGSPNVDDEHVPEHLRSTNAEVKENDWDIDSNWHKRWDHVLDEMIWAMTQIASYDDKDVFFDHSAVVESDKIMTQLNNIKVDSVGLDAHEKRKKNGCMLFGVYFQCLWD